MCTRLVVATAAIAGMFAPVTSVSALRATTAFARVSTGICGREARVTAEIGAAYVRSNFVVVLVDAAIPPQPLHHLAVAEDRLGVVGKGSARHLVSADRGLDLLRRVGTSMFVVLPEPPRQHCQKSPHRKAASDEMYEAGHERRPESRRWSEA